LEPASDAMKAAGVLMIVAAHNQGSGCGSITRLPAIYKSVITVGATDKNSDNIASYSSRGPIRVDGSNRRKPDLTAPGSQVLGANRRNTFSVMSGTSMATPAVSGAFALLWSAVPKLSRNIEKTLEIFEKTAKHQTSTQCDTKGSNQNHVNSHGSIDVHKAYLLAKEMGY